MPHEASPAAVVLCGLFAAGVLILSWQLGKRTKGAAGYFAAHGQVPWFVNGVAFAGDYLSVASFLGICGMIAFYGYDGFLYAIGLFAGWVVALLVIAEPMQRLGRFTFADALDAKFNSKGVRIAAGLSTLAVSVILLILQMVGAGALAAPLLGLPHWAGVTLVGGVVIAIVTTAGMVSTTWVQFIKGGLLVVFSTILVGLVLWRGLNVEGSGREGCFPESEGFAGIVVPVPAGDESFDVNSSFRQAANRRGFETLTRTGDWIDASYRLTKNRESGERQVWYEAVVRDGDSCTVFI